MSDALDRFAGFIDGLTANANRVQAADPGVGAYPAVALEPNAATIVAATTGCTLEANAEGHRARVHPPAGRKPEKAAWTVNDRQEVASRLSQQLETQNTASAARARHASDRSASAHTTHRSAGHASTDAPTRWAVPPEPLVKRLAAALATPRPWQQIADPDRARFYFEARARHMLATARDPIALVEHEERAAARWATPISTTTQKGPSP